MGEFDHWAKFEKIKHQYRPDQADVEHQQLKERIEMFGPKVILQSLNIWALSSPKQGSFAGALWALYEWLTHYLDLEERPVEVWKGDRKVTIYRDNVIRVWGPNMETEMSDEPRTHESIAAAMDWLYEKGETK